MTTDASIERIHVNRPDSRLLRPRKSFYSSPRKFIDSIVKGMEETFSNLCIDSDREVARVCFDYSVMSALQRN